VACLGLLVVACPGALENPERFLPVDAGDPCTVADVEPLIFGKSCGGAGCHQAFDGGSAASNNLDLIAPGIKTRIVKQVSGCNGLPMASYVLKKLSATQDCAGSRMPLGKAPLSANEVACVEAWVNSVLDAGSTDGGR
jgi:hypothetical protein